MAGVSIKRRPRTPVLISVVSMIDVLMIMLIFFMVTQTYLNLSMVPAVQADDPTAAAQPAAETPQSTTLLVRLGQDGSAVVGGRHLDLDGLQTLVSTRLSQNPDTPVIVLPSGAADTQALIAVIDRIAMGGATKVRIVRIEAAP
jgi:biopolymer transport protein ExbD